MRTNIIKLIWLALALIGQICAEEQTLSLKSGFNDYNMLRLKTNLSPTNCDGFLSIVGQIPMKNGRRRMAAIIKVEFNVKNNQLNIYQNLYGRFTKLAGTANSPYLLTDNQENTFTLKPINCYNGGCAIELKVNGKKITNTEMPGVGQIKISREHLQAVSMKARAKTCNFIRVFRLSAKQKLRSEKEDKFKSLNIATCGKSFKLTDSQRRGLSSNGLKDLLSAINSNVVKEHLDVCDAGRRGQTLAGNRIVGGTDSVPGLHPWIGAIIKEPRCSMVFEAHKCGATLIHDGQWLLSAAHCFLEEKSENKIEGNVLNSYRIKLGDYFNKGLTSFCNSDPRRHRINKRLLNENNAYNDVESDTEAEIETVFIHPSYGKSEGGGAVNDIALIKLKKPVKLDQFIQPACLPYRPQQFSIECCHIAGWGKTEARQDLDELPNRLQVSSIPTKPASVCKREYPNVDLKTAFCAGYPEGKAGEKHRDTCQGDSGGPFICKEGSDKFEKSYNGLEFDGMETGYLWGITSFGSATCKQTGVYTKVYSFMDWIHSTINSS